jgi:phosphoribosylaminoimidazole-succinocarboxamide synthase
MDSVVLSVELPGLSLRSRGKVRDIFELGERLLLVSTDRISAFDVVLPEGVPDKGKVLNQVSLFWFERLAGICPHHVLESDADRFPEPLPRHRNLLSGRSVVVRRLEMLAVECVVRGYLAGSGWKEYRERGSICGVKLPAGLREAGRLPEPIFTPTTKAVSGHDEAITFADVEQRVGPDLARRLRDVSIELYLAAARHAETRGILIADTKFEFGLDGGRLVLADEALTPDSSRFWPAEGYRPGVNPPSLDKQYVRDYLEGLRWDKKPPPPHLPPEIVARAAEKYRQLFRQLTGLDLKD